MNLSPEEENVKVLLINPHHRGKTDYPLGLLYIATVLDQRGDVDVRIMDLPVLGYTDEDVTAFIRDFAPDVVGITTMTYTYYKALQLAQLVKTLDESVLVVLGGSHVTYTSGQTLEENPFVDIVARGEGEVTMSEIVDFAHGERKLEDIRGISFRQDGHVLSTANRPLIEDLDRIPFPNRDLIPLQAYKDKIDYCSMISSRGCPYACRFCSVIFRPRYRMRTPVNVVDEMEIISRDYGFERISLLDDNFTVNRNHVLGICREIMGRGLDIEWGCSTRVDTVTKDLLGVMSNAGCKGLFIGYESGVQRVLDLMNKGTTTHQGAKVAQWAGELGIQLLASFILGFPGETVEDALNTVDYAKKLRASKVMFNFFVPLPGSEVYEERDRYGLTFKFDFKKLDEVSGNIPIVETPGMSLRDSIEVYLRAAKTFGGLE